MPNNLQGGMTLSRWTAVLLLALVMAWGAREISYAKYDPLTDAYSAGYPPASARIAGTLPAAGRQTAGQQTAGQQAADYPPDPNSDIPWSAGQSGLDDVRRAFDQARAAENAQLGTHLPPLRLPGPAVWQRFSDSQKALWLVNYERRDRGVLPLQGVEANVEGVAQDYARYLMENNAWGHSEDGRSPWERLESKPAIAACSDFLNIAENLAVFMTSAGRVPLPIERAVYGWLYEDAGSQWGHRHMLLWDGFTDNSGRPGREGFLGFGRAQGPFQGMNFAELMVVNVFDPCEGWESP